MMKVVVFGLHDKQYAIDVAHIVRVIRMKPITPIPDAAEFVAGVLSVRGQIIPVLTLHGKLGGIQGGGSERCRILIVRAGSQSAGIVVDRVVGVVHVRDQDITLPQEVLNNARYLNGVIRRDGVLILLIDATKLLQQEATSIAEVCQRVELRKKEPV